MPRIADPRGLLGQDDEGWQLRSPWYARLGAGLVGTFNGGWFDLGLVSAGAATIGAMSGVVFVVGLQQIGAARAAGGRWELGSVQDANDVFRCADSWAR